MRRTTSAVLALIAAASALTACGSSAPDGAQPAPAATSATQSTPAPSTATPAPLDSAVGAAPEFPSGTGRQLASNKGGWDLVPRDVRVSDRDGFDRVVVEFRGSGTPGWSARYVKTPRAEGSGDVVDVGGDNVLAVSISGVTFREAYPEAPEDFFDGPRHFTPDHGGVIRDVNIGGVFEGYSQLFLGVDGDKAPFRVFALTHPARLVVDVQAD